MRASCTSWELSLSWLSRIEAEEMERRRRLGTLRGLPGHSDPLWERLWSMLLNRVQDVVAGGKSICAHVVVHEAKAGFTVCFSFEMRT